MRLHGAMTRNLLYLVIAKIKSANFDNQLNRF